MSSTAAAASAASSYAAQLGVVQPLPSLRVTTGPYVWRADFDSANMERVEYTGSHPLEQTFTPAHMDTPDTFDCFVSPDPMSNYRVWFHCSVTGGRRGKQLRLRVRNLNNKKPLIGEGMLPLVRSTANHVWRRVSGIEYTTFNAPNGSGQARSFLPGDDGDGEEGEGEAEGEADEGGGAEESGSTLAASLAASSIAAASAAAPSNSSSISVSGKALTARKLLPSAAPAPASVPKAQAAPAPKPAAKRGRPKIKHDSMSLTITHTFDSDSEDETAFAFCLPYSYTQLQAQLLAYEKRFAPCVAAATVSSSGGRASSRDRDRDRDREVYFHRELLVHSIEGRRIDLLTVSSQAGRGAEVEPDVPGLYLLPNRDSRRDAEPARMWAPAPPASASSAAATGTAAACPAEPRACRFSPSSNKLLILLTARVHPGETPSSHMLSGALEFLLSTRDPRARLLRERCLFKVVPMLNPDGVARGYYRTDTLGQNLNRFYSNPSPELHPAPFAVRALVEQWREQPGGLFAYIDLHAHAVKRGLFLFGNHLAPLASEAEQAMVQSATQAHVRNVSYAKLVALNCPHLSLGNCSFAQGNMSAKDTRDGLSKEGSGRVAVYRATGCAHCYTAEVNYHCGRAVHPVAPLPEVPAFSGAGVAGAVAREEEMEEGRTVAASASSSGSASIGSSASRSSTRNAQVTATDADADADLSWQREDHLMAQESLVGPPVQYGEAHFRSMGKALMVALLDLLPPLPMTPQTQTAPAGTARADSGRHHASAASAAAPSSNPYSRLPASEYGNLAGVERWASQFIMAPPRKLARKLSKGTKNTANSAAASGASTAPASAASVAASSRSKNATPKTSPAASPRASLRNSK